MAKAFDRWPTVSTENRLRPMIEAKSDLASPDQIGSGGQPAEEPIAPPHELERVHQNDGSWYRPHAPNPWSK